MVLNISFKEKNNTRIEFSRLFNYIEFIKAHIQSTYGLNKKQHELYLRNVIVIEVDT